MGNSISCFDPAREHPPYSWPKDHPERQAAIQRKKEARGRKIVGLGGGAHTVSKTPLGAPESVSTAAKARADAAQPDPTLQPTPPVDIDDVANPVPSSSHPNISPENPTPLPDSTDKSSSEIPHQLPDPSAEHLDIAPVPVPVPADIADSPDPDPAAPREVDALLDPDADLVPSVDPVIPVPTHTTDIDVLDHPDAVDQSPVDPQATDDPNVEHPTPIPVPVGLPDTDHQKDDVDQLADDVVEVVDSEFVDPDSQDPADPSHDDDKPLHTSADPAPEDLHAPIPAVDLNGLEQGAEDAAEAVVPEASEDALDDPDNVPTADAETEVPSSIDTRRAIFDRAEDRLPEVKELRRDVLDPVTNEHISLEEYRDRQMERAQGVVRERVEKFEEIDDERSRQMAEHAAIEAARAEAIVKAKWTFKSGKPTKLFEDDSIIDGESPMLMEVDKTFDDTDSPIDAPVDDAEAVVEVVSEPIEEVIETVDIEPVEDPVIVKDPLADLLPPKDQDEPEVSIPERLKTTSGFAIGDGGDVVVANDEEEART